MVTTNLEFNKVTYPCRIVKDNIGEDLIIGSFRLLDALQPGNWGDENEGFVNPEASVIYDKIFYFTCDKDLNLPDAELIEVLKESNPEWFD